MTDDDKVRAAQALGKAITMRRTELGMKRTKLAEAAALSYPYLSEIENGRKQPSAEKLRSLADALDMAVVDLMGLAEVYEDDGAGAGAASVVSMSRTTRNRPLDSSVVDEGRDASSLLAEPSQSAGQAISEEVVRKVVRSELERWAVDVLPILMRQEIRRFLDDDHR